MGDVSNLYPPRTPDECRECGGPSNGQDRCPACRPHTASMLEPEPGALVGRPQDAVPPTSEKSRRTAADMARIDRQHLAGDHHECPPAWECQPAEALPATQEKLEYLIDAFSGERVLASEMDDGAILDWVDNYERQREAFEEAFAATIRSADAILERRLRERGAKAIPHPAYACELVPQFGPYQFDVDVLRRVAPLLAEEDAGKLLVHHPAREVHEVIPENWVPGNANAIVALAARIKGSPAGDLLASAISRPSFGSRLVRHRLAPQKRAKAAGKVLP
jgi:hypothetical protein